MGKFDNLNEGDAVGRCLFIKYVPRTDKYVRASLKCFCGKIFDADLCRVSNPKRQAGCGCLRSPTGKNSKQFKHGNSTRSFVSLAYNSWKAAKARCHNPKHKKYKFYGGRGIKMCDRWFNSFEFFFEDMGERPIGLTLDRFPDMKGNYEPGNCRWATSEEQVRNRPTNIFITFNGKTMMLIDWARETGIHRNTLRGRYYMGWSIQDMLTAKP